MMMDDDGIQNSGFTHYKKCIYVAGISIVAQTIIREAMYNYLKAIISFNYSKARQCIINARQSGKLIIGTQGNT